MFATLLRKVQVILFGQVANDGSGALTSISGSTPLRTKSARRDRPKLPLLAVAQHRSDFSISRARASA